MSKVFVLKNGTFAELPETKTKSFPGVSLEKIILATLAKDTCCVKNLTVDNITIQGETVFSIVEDEGLIANDQIAGFYPQGATNNITAGTGGAISVTNYFTTINTDAGGDAFSLANGTQIGQLKLIRLVADGGGDAVITPVNLASGTTITMNDAADEVELQWNGTDWVVIKNLGATVA